MREKGDTQEVARFLSLARRRIVPVASPGYSEFEYDEDDYTYVLEYFWHERRVVGCEIVYHREREVLRVGFATREKDPLVELLHYIWASRN